MARIYRVIQIKLNQLAYENAHMITDLPTKCIYKGCFGDKSFSEFLPTRWWQKSSGIDMEQNTSLSLYMLFTVECDVMSTYVYQCVEVLQTAGGACEVAGGTDN